MAAIKPRVAWFSNLPAETGRAFNGISSYASKILLPILAKEYEIDLFHNSFATYEDFPTFHCLTALRKHSEKPYDLFFYQLEDRPDTQWLRIHCGLMPGVQWSHDFLFTTFGPEPILNSPWKATLSKLENPEIEWPIRFDEQYQKGPYAIREAGYGIVRCFSQAGMLNDCKRENEVDVLADGQKNNHFVPLPVNDQIFLANSPANKRLLFCGTPYVQHRMHKVLAAVKDYDSALAIHWLLAENEKEAANDLLKDFDLENIEIEVGRSPERWSELVKEGGLAVHTLFSVFGQTGPYLQISLAAGVPCIVSRFGHSEDLPDSVVFKIQTGDTEAAEINQTLKAVFDNNVCPDIAVQKDFARELYSAQMVANELSILFKSKLLLVKQGMQRWGDLKKRARKDLLKEAVELLPGTSDSFGERRMVERVFIDYGWHNEG